ncbi:MmcQ/YjbR family DNA-binding protein [Nocardioides sp.]|uniref:MmcQ/YjbR family DNA-binding protein n=1 Tax=Nocardioides sp. TaxID=35761 RepID=UPI0035678A5E
MSQRIEPAPAVIRRLARIALALPEVHQEQAWTGVRWRIRARTFAHVMVSQEGYESAYRDATGQAAPTTVLTFHATGEELLALTNSGLPFYKPTWSPTVMGMVLDENTDWTEVGELVTDSYRSRAPQRLVRLLDES